MHLINALICEPCMDMGPPRHLSQWNDWRRQQPSTWRNRVVNRDVGYELVAVPMQAKTQWRREANQGYEPTRGKCNGVKGKREEPVPEGKGDTVEAQ